MNLSTRFITKTSQYQDTTQQYITDKALVQVCSERLTTFQEKTSCNAKTHKPIPRKNYSQVNVKIRVTFLWNVC